MNNNKPCILFARVSSKDQEETGYSLPAQQNLLREYANRPELGLKTSNENEFAISESASGKKQREIFRNMIKSATDNNIKIIVCEKIDRLTRSMKDAVDVSNWLDGDDERELHFIKEATVINKHSPSHQKFIWNVKVSVAQFYTDNLSEEVRKGQQEKAKQGWLPSKPPVGYKTIGDSGHKIHIIDENKAPLVIKMFELYATGNHSLKSITLLMEELGLRNDNSRPLVKSRVAELLVNPYYIGKFVWKDKLYEGKQKPLISEDLFNTVGEMLKSKTTPKSKKHNFLFKGLFRCKECQGTITWEIQKGIVYGHCNHYRNCSQKAWVKEVDVKPEVEKFIKELEIKNERIVEWIREALKSKYKEENEVYSHSVEELQLEKNRIQKMLDNLYDDKLSERIDLDTYNSKFEELKGKKTEVEVNINKYSTKADAFQKIGITLYELSQRSEAMYSKVLPEEKRELMRLVFEEMNINEGKVILKYTKPFEILRDTIAKTNSSKVIKKEDFDKDIFELSKSVTVQAQYTPLEIEMNHILAD